MIKATFLAVLMTLAVAGSALGAGTLVATSGDIGPVVVGSCDLSTFDGCIVKTITLTSKGGKTGISAISVRDGNIGLDPRRQPSGACTNLPIKNNQWILRANRSCTISVAVNATVVGPLERELDIWGRNSTLILAVPITAEGV